MKGSGEFKIQVVGSDQRMDVAVRKITAKRLVAVPLGDSDPIEVGESLWIWGR